MFLIGIKYPAWVLGLNAMEDLLMSFRITENFGCFFYRESGSPLKDNFKLL